MPGTLIKPGTSAHVSSGASYPSAVHGSWLVLHDDLTATAETSTVLLRPFTTASANVHPCHVPDLCSRMFLRGRYPEASTITTNATVRLYGTLGELNSSDWFTDTDSGAESSISDQIPVRLDNAIGSGVAVLLADLSDMRMTTYKYGQLIQSGYDGLYSFDTFGCKYVFALTESAAVISAGTAQLMVAFGN